MFCFFSFSLPGFISHPPFLQAAIPIRPIRDTFSDNIVMLEFGGKTILQWNPVNTVTNGSKKIGRFNGAGSDFMTQYRYDKYTVHRIRTSCTTVFSLLNYRNVDIAYRNCKNILLETFL